MNRQRRGTSKPCPDPPGRELHRKCGRTLDQPAPAARWASFRTLHHARSQLVASHALQLGSAVSSVKPPGIRSLPCIACLRMSAKAIADSKGLADAHWRWLTPTLRHTHVRIRIEPRHRASMPRPKPSTIAGTAELNVMIERV